MFDMKSSDSFGDGVSLRAKHGRSSHEAPPDAGGKQRAASTENTHTQSVGRPVGKQTLKASWGAGSKPEESPVAK